MFGKRKTKTIKDMLLEKEQEEKIKKELSKTQYISDNTKIIIEQKSKITNFFLILIEITNVVVKIILIVIVCILTTIGGTVLFNEVLREFFFEMVNIPFLDFL